MFTKSSRTAVIAALIAVSHAGAEPLPYGKSIAPDATAITDYQAHIAELQREHGSHGFALAEHWMGLGLAQRNAADHAGAVDSFANALQIQRTHLGLHDPGQIPVIDLLIESHRALGNWEQVDAHFKLLASVHRHELGDEVGRLVAIWLRYARWQREAHQLPTSTPPYEHLLLGGYAAEQAHDIAIEAYGERDPRLLEILYLRAAIAYDVARHMSTGDGKVGTTLEQLITAPGLTTSEFVARQNDRAISQRNHIIHNFIDGRVPLEAAVKIHQSTGDVSGEAIAATLPGDWHFLFDRPQTAAKQYSEAQRLFVASSADPAGAFLSKPLALPVFAAAAGNASASFTSDANVDSALARFVVDAKGRARNIEIVETKPAGSKDIARKARKYVAATLFRARIDNGKAVRTPNVEIRYVFPEPNDDVRQQAGSYRSRRDPL